MLGRRAAAVDRCWGVILRSVHAGRRFSGVAVAPREEEQQQVAYDLLRKVSSSSPRASVCPLTGRPNRAVPVLRHPQFLESEIVECLETGLQYVDPVPSADALERLYDEQYNGCFGRDFGAPAPAFVDRRARAQLKFLDDHLPKSPTSSAEAGAGWGALAELLKARGAQVSCYELDRAAVHYMQRRGLDRAHFGTLESSAEHSLDLICSSMMLEHLPDPLASAKAWRAKLKPTGHLFVEIPLEHPVPNWFGRDPANPYWVGHLTFFAKHHLPVLLDHAGFEVLVAHCFDHPVSPGYVMPGQPFYDVDEVPVHLDTQPSDSEYPRLLRLVAAPKRDD